MNRRIKWWIKALCFVLGLVVMLALFQHVFVYNDFRIYQTFSSFYAEKEDSLDAVYIGASNVYPYYEAPLVWKDYGIAVHPLSVAALPAAAVKPMIIEARKTQPNALFIINLNNFNDETISLSHIHYLADYMPFSRNKIDLINTLCDQRGIAPKDRLEFYLPFIRYHSSWDELKLYNFYRRPNGLKGASTYNLFLTGVEDVTYRLNFTDERKPMPDVTHPILEDLLNYCQKEDLNVLFVIAPQALSADDIAKFNTMADIVASQGYPVINAMECIEDTGLDFSQDFYNGRHANIHGAIKFSHFIGQYLSEHYDFEDKRGLLEYASWDEAATRYIDIIDDYCLDFEWMMDRRCFELEKPAFMQAQFIDDQWHIEWTNSENASGYAIYRLQDGGTWECLGTTESCTYTDLSADRHCTYTVVPYVLNGESMSYGQYHVQGVGSLRSSTDVSLNPDNTSGADDS